MHTYCTKFHQNVPTVRLYILHTFFFKVLQTDYWKPQRHPDSNSSW